MFYYLNTINYSPLIKTLIKRKNILLEQRVVYASIKAKIGLILSSPLLEPLRSPRNIIKNTLNK